MVSGGYEDDEDYGNEIIYTGAGGRDPASGRQVADQELKAQNLALARSRDLGLPVRVVRGANARSPYAPSLGYRYDGLFSVDDVWTEIGRSGFKVIRYRLRNLEPRGEPIAEPLAPPLPPGRRLGTISRIVRDTGLTRMVKELYGYACQVCGIVLQGPSGPYAEAAHIQPLGEPHNGPDILENVLCLCPNHHVLFDLGAVTIADDLALIGIEGRLTVESKHRVGPLYVAYHRTHYGGLRES